MPNRPNLLFIFTDQQRADTMACYGNHVIQAPNLNRLAEQSFVFENTYVSQPVCTPSRSTIMTGLYPHTNGCIENSVPLPAQTKTIAEMVSPEYRRGYFGKWHLGDELSPQHGFEHWLRIEDNYRKSYSDADDLPKRSDYHAYLIENGYEPDKESAGQKVFSRPMAARLPVEHTKASFLGREVAGFLRESDGEPFVLFVNFLEPHAPFVGPFNDLHPHDHLNTGPAFLKKPSRNASMLHRVMADYYGQARQDGVDLSSESGWREIRARYWGLVTLVDRAVGVILGALEATGQAENTVVVYTSEHGDMQGDHGILNKTVMYEESMKVPLLMRVPWLAGNGKNIRGRLSQIDLVPTLLDLLGESIPSELEGQSRAAVLQGASDLQANDAFVQWNGSDGHKSRGFETDVPAELIAEVAETPRRTIIASEGWKLNLSPGDNAELYDLNSDPHELVNLYDEPDQQDRVQDLTERLVEWQRRFGDEVPLSRP